MADFKCDILGCNEAAYDEVEWLGTEDFVHLTPAHTSGRLCWDHRYPNCRVPGCEWPVPDEHNPNFKWHGTPIARNEYFLAPNKTEYRNPKQWELAQKDEMGYCKNHFSAMYYEDGERRFHPVAPPSPKRRGDIRADYLSDAMMYLTLILSLILWYYKFEIKNQLTNDFDGFSWGCCLYLILLPFVMILLSGPFDWFAYTLITGNEYEKEP